MTKPLRARTLQRDQTFQLHFSYLLRLVLEETHGGDLPAEIQPFYAERMAALMDRLVHRLHRQHRLHHEEALAFVRKLVADSLGDQALIETSSRVPLYEALGQAPVL